MKIYKTNSVICPVCNNGYETKKIEDNYMICGTCSYYFAIPARKRIEYLVDPSSFRELFLNVKPYMNNFPEYKSKFHKAQKASGENEAVICGEAKIGNEKVVIFVMEPFFMMGSMGRFVGEKITLCFEYATKKKIPVIGVCSSSGARIQEGLYSLMQMSKIMNAVSLHDKKGNLFISIITNPTLGGTMASFAMNGDYIIAEPNATAGFAGQKIIKMVEHKKLSEEFQKAETLLNNGYIDSIIPRDKQRQILSFILKFHKAR